MKTISIIKIAILSSALFIAPAAFACGSGSCGAASSKKSAGDTKNVKVWTCSMHPEIKKDKPGKCPKCGMALIPAKTPTKKK